MKAYIQHASPLQFQYVSFYTLQVEGRALPEFKDFQRRMSMNTKDLKQMGYLNSLIRDMGTQFGAQEHFFKREGFAERLPAASYRFLDSDGVSDFGLRLYCVWLSSEIVILLNGGRKTAQRIENCPNCYPHFLFANLVSDAIYQARKDDMIELDGLDILMEEDFVLNLG